MTETTDLASLPRETGQEKSSSTCPNCGATLGVVETEYGGKSPEACKKCYPASAPGDANARQQAGAGSSSTPRELGTVTDPAKQGGHSA